MRPRPEPLGLADSVGESAQHGAGLANHRRSNLTGPRQVTNEPDALPRHHRVVVRVALLERRVEDVVGGAPLDERWQPARIPRPPARHTSSTSSGPAMAPMPDWTNRVLESEEIAQRCAKRHLALLDRRAIYSRR